MRKIFYLVISIVIFGLIISGCIFHVVPPLGQDGSIDIVKNDVFCKIDLIAGQHTIAGSITVSNDDENLFVTYETADSWLINETHLYVGTTIPTNSAPGKFPYKREELGGVTTDTYEIPLDDLGVVPCDIVYIAAHAELVKGEIEETGWAEGVEIELGKNWAMYFDYQIICNNYSEYEKMAKMTDKAIDEFVENCEIYGEDQAKQMIVDSLLGKDEVINAGIGIDNESIWFQWKNGIISSFSEYPELDGQQKSLCRSFDSKEILMNSKDIRNTPENNKAIIFDWEDSIISTLYAKGIQLLLEAGGYDVKFCPKSEFTLYKLENINEYGVIYISSHGMGDNKYGIKILTGQEIIVGDEASDEVWRYFENKYGYDKCGSMIGAHTFYENINGQEVPKERYFCFYPNFIREIALYDSFPKSLIYADTCYSLANVNIPMADAFIDRGAYVYCGYDAVTRAGCVTDEYVFFLLLLGMNLENAIFAANNLPDLPFVCSGIDFDPEDHGDFYLVNGGSGPVHNLTLGTYYNTIQAALGDADSGDTIEVADGTYDESIVFPYKKAIILQSVNGPSSTIIRGDDDSNTVFMSNSLEGTTLNGFTITHESGNTGRGIRLIHNSYLIINNSNISDNFITDFVGSHTGGGISATESCELTINGSTISGNSASSGGGIGGYMANITINGSTISGNSATYVGGGISKYYGTLTITESTISNNILSDSHSSGGGIFNVGDTLTITESTVSSNSAGLNGGGISARESSNIFITNSTISNNTALEQYGGGIYNSTEEKINLTITGSILSGNSAFLCGGGIYLLPEFMETVTIGGSSENDFDNFNQFINNYKIGDDPSPDQHISNFKRDCHMDYPYNYYTPDNNGTYALRDIGPAGGYIFYDKGSYSDGWRYLEAASASTEWRDKKWGSIGTFIGGTETGIGRGQSNTTTIVTWLNSHSETDRAAQLCDALTEGGYSDWFLPSKDELNLMFTNLKVFGVGGFEFVGYWSSSECSAGFAWYQSFSLYIPGTQYCGWKEINVRVRAVRAF